LVTHKNILITAGPTWVAIDSVRVISNTATGNTGILLSKAFLARSAKVTLLLGPAERSFSDKRVRVIRYRFFDELNNLLAKELKTGAYDAVIHAAAVSDYRPKQVYRKKVSSRLRGWNIKLVPTPKLINNLSSGKKRLLKVGFKFEPEAADKRLIAEGRDLLKESGLDFVVANTVNKKAYRAFIIGMSGIAGPLLSKAAMSKQLCGLLNKE